jgi:hypothetical protein
MSILKTNTLSNVANTRDVSVSSIVETGLDHFGLLSQAPAVSVDYTYEAADSKLYRPTVDKPWNGGDMPDADFVEVSWVTAATMIYGGKVYGTLDVEGLTVNNATAVTYGTRGKLLTLDEARILDHEFDGMTKTRVVNLISNRLKEGQTVTCLESSNTMRNFLNIFTEFNLSEFNIITFERIGYDTLLIKSMNTQSPEEFVMIVNDSLGLNPTFISYQKITDTGDQIIDGNVSALNPTNPEHLSTKIYTDNFIVLSNTTEELQNQIVKLSIQKDKALELGFNELADKYQLKIDEFSSQL